MTDETRAKRRVSKTASGERSDPRADEACEEAVSTTHASEPASAARLVADGGRNPEDSFSLAGDGESSLAAEFPGGEDAEPESGTPTDEDGEVEPVELLVQLAKEGEIEPWDIDIVEVTDAFLERLDEADLRTSGRALFYASVLLRMKSDALLERPSEDEDEPELEPWEEGFEPEDGGGFDPVAGLESEMERRLERKPQRGSPETLDELVRDLREAERGSWWKESRTYDTDGSPRGFQRGVQELDYRSGDDFRMDDEPTEEEALGTAHQEDIEETIADVETALDDQYEKGRAEVLFEEVAGTGGSRVQTFLALLFLAHRGAVQLEQDELFGDLWVKDVVRNDERSEE